eukprot:gene27457-33160_t
MKTLLDVYESDVDGLNYNSCYVSLYNIQSKYLAITSPKGLFPSSYDSLPLTFVLNATDKAQIPTNTCILSAELYKLLGLSYGSTLSSFSILLEPTIVQGLSLSFVGYYSPFHWDEYPEREPSHLPNSFVDSWPSGLSMRAYTQLLPSLLRNWVFIKSNDQEKLRGGVILPALSVFMVFEISSISLSSAQPVDSTPFTIYKVSPDTQIIINIPSSPSQHQSLPSSLSATASSLLEYDYLSAFLPRMLPTLAPTPTPLHPALPAARTFLLYGPRGSGKTHALKNLSQLASKSVKVLLSPLPSLPLLPPLPPSPSLLFILEEVLRHLFHTSLEEALNLEGDGKVDSLVLCLDDIHTILSPSSSALSSEESMEESVYLDMYAMSKDGAGGQGERVSGMLRQYIHTLTDVLTNPSTYSPSSAEIPSIYLVGTSITDFTKASSVVDPGGELLEAVCRGRFDLCLPLLKPSQADREHIISSLISPFLPISDPNIPIPQPSSSFLSTSKSSNVVHLAALTRGYLPGDLATLIQVVRDRARLNGGEITWTSLLEGVTTFHPPSLDYFQMQFNSRNRSKTSYSWRDLAGYEDLLSPLQRKLAPLFAPKACGSGAHDMAVANKLRMKYDLPRGLVISGPSGCGKSLLGKVLASELHMNLLSIQSTEILSMYFGQTEQKIRDLFQQARLCAPCLLLFDDFDALAHKRGMDDDTSSNLHNRILSTFLNELDGIVSHTSQKAYNDQREGVKSQRYEDVVLVVVVCRDVNMLDEALIRPGRLHEHVHLPILLLPAFIEVIQHYMNTHRIAFSDSDVLKIADRIRRNTHISSPMLTGALAEAIVKEGVLECAHKSIRIFEETGAYGEDPVTIDDILLKVDTFYPPLISPPLPDQSFAFGSMEGGIKFSIGV